MVNCLHSQVDLQGLDLTASPLARLIFTAARKAGLDFATAIARHRLPYSATEMNAGQVPAMPAAHFAALHWECIQAIEMATAMEDERVPVIGVNMLELMCRAMASCDTLREAIEVSAQFQAAFERQRITLDLQEAADHAILTLTTQRKRMGVEAFILDLMGLLFYSRFLGWISGSPLPDAQLQMNYPGLAGESAMRLVVLHRVELTRKRNAVQFGRAALDRPIIRSGRDTCRMLRLFFHDIFFAHFQDGDRLTERLRLIYRNSLDRNTSIPTLPEIAELLGKSSATIKRKLADEGVTASELVTETRRQLAQELLLGSAASIEHIAERTGFSDARAFRRAFHEWAGLSPAAFRRSGTLNAQEG